MFDWAKIAFLFPGQNSQEVGMGRDIATAYAVAHDTFAEADDILGFSLSQVCFEGPEEELNDTINTQPAIYVCSIAILRALQAELSEAIPGFVAGHSLGELTALTASGALPFADGVKLVRERGRLMKEAGEKSPGAMAAILGLDADVVRDICLQVEQEVGETLILANDNCPGQIVISGSVGAIQRGLEVAIEQGAKRAIQLAVSIAAHSPLMQSASEEFQQALQNTNFHDPQIPIYANVTTQPLSDAEAIRNELNVQLTQSVRWTESIQNMVADGADIFVEVGSKDVLSGLMKRIDRSKDRHTINSLASLQLFVESF